MNNGEMSFGNDKNSFDRSQIIFGLAIAGLGAFLLFWAGVYLFWAVAAGHSDSNGRVLKITERLAGVGFFTMLGAPFLLMGLIGAFSRSGAIANASEQTIEFWAYCPGWPRNNRLEVFPFSEVSGIRTKRTSRSKSNGGSTISYEIIADIGSQEEKVESYSSARKAEDKAVALSAMIAESSTSKESFKKFLASEVSY